MASSASATRPSTATSGVTSAVGACATSSFDSPARSAGNATAPMTPVVTSPVSVTSPSDPLLPRTEPSSVTGRSIPCSAPLSTASSPSSRERSDISSSASSATELSLSSTASRANSSTQLQSPSTPSLPTTVPSSRATSSSRPPPPPASSSPPLTTPGKGEPTKTPTVSSDSTCPNEQAWLASPRPTVTASPVDDPEARKVLRSVLDTQLADPQAWILRPDGVWERLSGGGPTSQRHFMMLEENGRSAR